MTAPAAPIILVTTGHPTLHQHPGPDGENVHPRLGRLLQPRHTSSVELTAAAGIPWAADNDCFQSLDEVAYVRMLDRLEGLAGCLFVSVPDVVGDAAATFERFERWAPELERRGLPLGLVAQDGMTVADLEDRADRLAALFIGGSTEWKEGPQAAELAIAAKRLGLWVHWGRVNTRRRFDLIVATGAADSFDGSKWARFRKTYLDGGLAWLDEAADNRREAIAAGATPDPSTQEDPSMPDVKTSARSIREVAARLAILDKFDTYRAARPFDMTASRRRRAILVLEEALRVAKRERELDLLVNPGDIDGVASAGGLEPSYEDLRNAFVAEVRRRLGRPDARVEVAGALNDVAVELELGRPVELAALVDDEGKPHDCVDLKPAGGSRRRRSSRAAVGR